MKNMKHIIEIFTRGTSTHKGALEFEILHEVQVKEVERFLLKENFLCWSTKHSKESKST